MRMYCQVGNFHWDYELDGGHCPNHGSHDKWGNVRGKVYSLCDENGPYDVKRDTDSSTASVESFLDCCSIPEEMR